MNTFDGLDQLVLGQRAIQLANLGVSAFPEFIYRGIGDVFKQEDVDLVAGI